MRSRHLARLKHRKRYTVLLIPILLAVLFVLSYPWLQMLWFPAIPAKSGKTVDAIVAILPEQRSRTVPAQFLGFSIEMNNVCSFLQTQKHHPEINTYLANLQPLVLRIGGISADHLSWQAERNCPSWYAQSFGATFVDNLFAYARQHHLKVIWTVNFTNDQPTMAAQEAAYAYKVGGANLLGVSIGNEPNDYHETTYSQLMSRWQTYATAIQKLAPGVPILGPDTARLTGCESSPCRDARDTYFLPFLKQYATAISAATTHYYPLSSKTATLQELLAPSTMNYFGSTIQSSKVIQPANPPLIIDEANSAYGGGRHGVSDTFAAGLWGLDYLYTAAETGIQGVYFHSSLGTSDLAYSPIGQNIYGTYVTGLYYAMLLFHQVAQNGTIVKTETHTPINLTSHATISPSQTLQLVIVNKDLTTNADTTIAIPDEYHTATYMRLEAAKANTVVKDIQLGGSAVTRTGQWQPASVSRLAPTDGKLTISIPAATAVAIQLQ